MANRKNTFLLKRSNVPNKVPSPGDLALGELALNTADAILYVSGTTANQILPIGWDRLSILSGGTVNGNVTVNGFISASTYLNLPVDPDTYVTGFTYNNINQLVLSRNQGLPNLSVNINNLTLTGLTVNGSVSATTYYGDGSNLTGLVTNDYYVTGGTFSANTLTLNRQNGSVVITGFTSGVGSDTYVTGFTYNSNNLTISQNNGSNYTVNISTMTGLTINGNLTVTSDIDTTNLYTQYLFDKSNNYGTPGQILVSTNTGVEWTSLDVDCKLTTATTSNLEYKYIDNITGFTSGSYIVKSYITAYSGTSKYGFWERTLGVVTTGNTPVVSIITQDFDDYSSGFLPTQIDYIPKTGNTIDIYISGLTSENLYWESYYDIIGQSCRPIINVLPSSNLGSFGLSLSNGAAILSTGQKGYVKMPYPGTITDWTIMTDTTGSIIIDIWKDTVASFPPTSIDTITGGNYATLTNQLINSDNLLTGWTTTFLANDVFTFDVIGVTGITNINLTLNVIKN